MEPKQIVAKVVNDPAEPVPVIDVGGPPPPTDKQLEHKDTETEKRTVGQRRINLLWELCQAFIAASVVAVALYVAGKIVLSAMEDHASDRTVEMATVAFNLLSNLATLVIGFYFGRTNHQRTGGVKDADVGR